MTQYPPSTQGFDPYAPNQPQQQMPRTSVLAILSLICALLCLTSPLALVFGGLAIVMISRSNGRLKGFGLAIAGTVIGLLFSTGLIAIVVGAAKVNSMFGSAFMAPIAAVVQDVEKGNVQGVRSSLSPTLNAATTDEEIAAFRSDLAQNFGAYKGYPSTIFQIFEQYMSIGNEFQKLQAKLGSTQNMLPMPIEFDKGVALVIIKAPNSTNAGGTFKLTSIERLGIYLPASDEIVWIDEAGDQSGTPVPAKPGSAQPGLAQPGSVQPQPAKPAAVEPSPEKTAPSEKPAEGK